MRVEAENSLLSSQNKLAQGVCGERLNRKAGHILALVINSIS